MKIQQGTGATEFLKLLKERVFGFQASAHLGGCALIQLATKEIHQQSEVFIHGAPFSFGALVPDGERV